MEYLIIAVVSVWAVEVFLRLPVRRAVDDLWRVSKKAMHTVASPHISDHWKEKVMLAYAGKSLGNTLKLAAWMLVFIALALVPALVIDYFRLTGEPVLALLSSPPGLIASTVCAIAYAWLRGRFAR